MTVVNMIVKLYHFLTIVMQNIEKGIGMVVAYILTESSSSVNLH